MFKGLEYKALKQALALIAVCSSVISLNVQATDSQAFFNKLKEHYQPTQSIEKFSLNYHFYNKQYRSQNYWDFQSPDRVLSVRMVEVDTKKSTFTTTTYYTAQAGIFLIGFNFKTIPTVTTTRKTAII